MIIKATVIFTLARISGTRNDIAIQAAVLLSQSGEFGFVMFGFATISGVLDSQISQTLTLIIALSMVLTPFVVKITNVLLLKLYTPKTIDDDFCNEFIEGSKAHVVLAGFGRVGARIGAILNTAGVSYIALETNHQRVKTARAQGFPVFYGDACNVKVLRAAGTEQAKMIVVSLDDPHNVDRMVTLIRQYYPNMPIHARAKDRQHCADLTSLGVTTAISETLETSLRLTHEILLRSGLNEDDAKKAINEFRDDYYLDVVQKVTENKVVMGELRH